MTRTKLAMLALVALFCVAGLYWIALTAESNSELLFWLALIPITAPFASILGTWSLVVEVPQWLLPYFG